MKLHARNLTRDHRRNLSIAAKQRGGHPHTYETRIKMSCTRKGRKSTEEHKKNISAALKGRTINEEMRKKISATLKGKLYWNNGIKNIRSENCPGQGWMRGRVK